MRILVTGAAGFIGFHLTRRLLSDGHQVVGIDNLSPCSSVQLKRDRLARIGGEKRAPGDFVFHEKDICDHAFLSRLMEASQPDCVVHLAAQPGARCSAADPFAYQKTNLEGFLSVLECCRHASKKPRLVYASSSSVYGSNATLPFSEDQAADSPLSLYAATKKANEGMAHAYAHLYGLQTIGLRFFTAYGPWCRPDMAIYLFAEAMTQGRPLAVFNNGKMTRDFTYVGDIVEGAVGCVAGSTFGPCEIFNVGSGKPENILDIIDLLALALGVKPELQLLPMQAGDMPATWADITRLRAKTGYEPKTALARGIPAFASWYTSYVLGAARKSGEARMSALAEDDSLGV